MIERAALLRERVGALVEGRGRRGGGQREGVYKPISWLKAKASVRRAVDYVARVRPEDVADGVRPPEVWHEAGIGLTLPLDGVDDIAQALESWELLADGDNLSRRARRAGEVQRALMPVGERLRLRQALHAVFSAVISGGAAKGAFREAARAAIVEAFVNRGHRVIWAIHDDHPGRVHVHMVVESRRKPDVGDREAARRLRSEHDTPERVRRLFVRHAWARGLDVVATMRQDRTDLRKAIAEGREWLRPSSTTAFEARQGQMLNRLILAAPRWSARELLGYERRRARQSAARRRLADAARSAWVSARSNPPAKSWSETSERLAPAGFRLETRGRRLLLVGADGSCDVDSLDGRAARRELEARLGPFAPGSAAAERGGFVAPRDRAEAQEFLSRVVGDTFVDPTAALDSYRRLRGEIALDRGQGLAAAQGRRRRKPEHYADWLLMHAPQVFGETRDERPASPPDWRRALLLAAPWEEAPVKSVTAPVPPLLVSGARATAQARAQRQETAEAARFERWRRDVNRMVVGLARLGRETEEAFGWDPARRREAEAILALARDALGRAAATWARAQGSDVARDTAGMRGRDPWRGR